MRMEGKRKEKEKALVESRQSGRHQVKEDLMGGGERMLDDQAIWQDSGLQWHYLLRACAPAVSSLWLLFLVIEKIQLPSEKKSG